MPIAMAGRKRRFMGGPRVLARSRQLLPSRPEISHVQLGRAFSLEAKSRLTATAIGIVSPLAEPIDESVCRNKADQIIEKQESTTMSPRKRRRQSTAPKSPPNSKRDKKDRKSRCDGGHVNRTTNVYWIINTSVYHCCCELHGNERKGTQCQEKPTTNRRGPHRTVSKVDKVSQHQDHKRTNEIPPAKKRKVSSQLERQNKDCQLSQQPKCCAESGRNCLRRVFDCKCNRKNKYLANREKKEKCVRFVTAADVRDSDKEVALTEETVVLKEDDVAWSKEPSDEDQEREDDTLSIINANDQYGRKLKFINCEDQQNNNSDKENIDEKEYKNESDESECSEGSLLLTGLQQIHAWYTANCVTSKCAIEETIKGYKAVATAEQAVQVEIEKGIPVTGKMVDIVDITTQKGSHENKECTTRNDEVSNNSNSEMEMPNLIEETAEKRDSAQVEMEDEDDREPTEEISTTSDEAEMRRETWIRVTASLAEEKFEDLKSETKEEQEATKEILSNVTNNENAMTDVFTATDELENADKTAIEDQESPENNHLTDTTEPQDKAECHPLEDESKSRSDEDFKNDGTSNESGEAETKETPKAARPVEMQVTDSCEEEKRDTEHESDNSESTRTVESHEILREGDMTETEDGVEMEIEAQKVVAKENSE